MKLFKLLLVALMLVLPGMLVQAQGPLPVAVVYNNALYVLNTVPRFAEELPQALTLVSDAPTDDYRAVWSPDGTKLAYTANSTLRVWDGTQSIDLASGSFMMDMPLSWTRDGLIVYMLAGESNTPQVPAQVYTIAPQAGAVPDKVIDGLNMYIACGIGTRLPMEVVYWNEAGELGAQPLVALTDYGLVYPAECNTTMSLYRPFSAETVTLGSGKLNDVVLSADETRAAGLDTDTRDIVIVDLTTMETTSLTPTGNATTLAWGRDGSLYYASVTQSRNLLDGLTPEQVAQVNVLFGNDASDTMLGANTVSLYRIGPDQTVTLLHEQDAYRVGRMAVKGTALVYSTIANGDTLKQMIVGGAVPADAHIEDLMWYIPVSLNYLALSETGTVLEAGTIPGDLHRFAVSR